MQQHSFKTTTTFASETIVDTRYYQYKQDLLLARSAITAKKIVEDSTCTTKTSTRATAIGCMGDWGSAGALPEKAGGIGKKQKKHRPWRKKTKKKKQTEQGKEKQTNQHLRLFEHRLKNMSDFEKYVYHIKQERKEREKEEQEDEVDGSFRVIARAGNVDKKAKKVQKEVKLEYRPWTGVRGGKVDVNEETTWMPYEGGLVSIDSFFQSRKGKDGDRVLQGQVP
jgi:hypothetical protein